MALYAVEPRKPEGYVPPDVEWKLEAGDEDALINLARAVA